jgi:putative aldouronate transport system substrate-binding protein
MKKISRREMLKMAGVGSAGLVLAACAPQAATQATAQATAAATTGPAATSAPAATAMPATTGKAVKITLVESWFSVTQDKAVLDTVNKVISDKMKSEGLNIEIESLVLDDRAAKYPLLYSSGADFTMAFDAPWNLMDTLRTQGSLAVLDDLFDQHGPKLKEAITDKILKANTWDDKLYGIPVPGHYNITSGVVLRQDLLEKYGAAAPDPMVGWPSLEPYLQAIADNEPDMIPFAYDPNYPPMWEGVLLKRTMGYWQGTNSRTGIIIPDISAGRTLLDIETVPEMVETARLMRSWWEKDLINKTDLPSASGTANLLSDYFFPGKLASLLVNEPNYLYYEYGKTIKSSIPDAVLKGYDMSGIQVGRYRGVGQLKQGNFIVFNAVAPQEQLVAAMQFFNWLVSHQDNVDLWLMGVDGVNYKKEDNMLFSEVPGVDPAKNFRRAWYVGGIPAKFRRESVDLPADAIEETRWADTESNFDFDPYESFYPDTTAGDLQTQMAQLQAAWTEGFHGFATGQAPTDEAIATMKQTLDDAGRQEYKAAVQKQLDDYIAAHPAS